MPKWNKEQRKAHVVREWKKGNHDVADLARQVALRRNSTVHGYLEEEGLWPPEKVGTDVLSTPSSTDATPDLCLNTMEAPVALAVPLTQLVSHPTWSLSLWSVDDNVRQLRGEKVGHHADSPLEAVATYLQEVRVWFDEPLYWDIHAEKDGSHVVHIENVGTMYDGQRLSVELWPELAIELWPEFDGPVVCDCSTCVEWCYNQPPGLPQVV